MQRLSQQPSTGISPASTGAPGICIGGEPFPCKVKDNCTKSCCMNMHDPCAYQCSRGGLDVDQVLPNTLGAQYALWNCDPGQWWGFNCRYACRDRKC